MTKNNNYFQFPQQYYAAAAAAAYNPYMQFSAMQAAHYAAATAATTTMLPFSTPFVNYSAAFQPFLPPQSSLCQQQRLMDDFCSATKHADFTDNSLHLIAIEEKKENDKCLESPKK